MAKHTKGPWRAFIEVNDRNGWDSPRQTITIGTQDALVATYITDYAEYPDDATNEANAHLIAAAPEMYEALRSFVYEFGDKTNSATVNKARAALRKAEGAAQ